MIKRIPVKVVWGIHTFSPVVGVGVGVGVGVCVCVCESNSVPKRSKI